MSRRRSAPPTAPPPRPTARRETGELGEGTRYILIGGVALLGVAVFAVIGYLVYQSLFNSNPVVLRVGDEEVHHDYFTARLASYIEEQGGTVPGENILPFGQTVLDDIAEEEILLQSLEGEGLSVTDDEVDAEIQQRIGVTKEEDFALFRAGLEAELVDSRLSEDQYRHVVRAELARSKLAEHFLAQIGETAEQARFHRLNPVTEADAEAARERLLAGEDFAAIALDLDPTAVEPEEGPEFVVLQTLEEEIREALAELEPNEVSEPILIRDRYAVLQLLEREVLPIEEGQRPTIGAAALAVFIEDQAEVIGVEEDLSDEELVDALEEAI
jgi:parvulin-like peptidyl-prolyl isomerase